jgi:hypothetical protein
VSRIIIKIKLRICSCIAGVLSLSLSFTLFYFLSFYSVFVLFTFSPCFRTFLPECVGIDTAHGISLIYPFGT